MGMVLCSQRRYLRTFERSNCSLCTGRRGWFLLVGNGEAICLSTHPVLKWALERQARFVGLYIESVHLWLRTNISILFLWQWCVQTQGHRGGERLDLWFQQDGYHWWCVNHDGDARKGAQCLEPERYRTGCVSKIKQLIACTTASTTF